MNGTRNPDGVDAKASTLSRLVVGASEPMQRWDVSEREFIEFLQAHEQRLGQLPEPPSASELSDLVLTCGCLLGKSSALKAFEADCLPEYSAVAAKLRLTEERRADCRQLLWQRLLIGEGRLPRLLEYRGQGRLRHWFRVVVSRFLLNELRSIKRERETLMTCQQELALKAEGDPELQLLEMTYRQHFRSALARAISELSPEERNTLRCHYVQAMSIDLMATAFGIHRATAARRVVHAREELLRRTTEQLRQLLGFDTEELQSVIRRVHAQSSMSVARLLEQGS